MRARPRLAVAAAIVVLLATCATACAATPVVTIAPLTSRDDADGTYLQLTVNVSTPDNNCSAPALPNCPAPDGTPVTAFIAAGVGSIYADTMVPSTVQAAARPSPAAQARAAQAPRKALSAGMRAPETPHPALPTAGGRGPVRALQGATTATTTTTGGSATFWVSSTVLGTMLVNASALVNVTVPPVTVYAAALANITWEEPHITLAPLPQYPLVGTTLLASATLRSKTPGVAVSFVVDNVTPAGVVTTQAITALTNAQGVATIPITSATPQTVTIIDASYFEPGSNTSDTGYFYVRPARLTWTPVYNLTAAPLAQVAAAGPTIQSDALVNVTLFREDTTNGTSFLVPAVNRTLTYTVDEAVPNRSLLSGQQVQAAAGKAAGKQAAPARAVVQSGTVTTDDQGVAVISVLGGLPGAVSTVSVTFTDAYNNTFAPAQPAVITWLPVPSLALSMPQPVLALGQTAVVTAVVLDAAGVEPLANATVTFDVGGIGVVVATSDGANTTAAAARAAGAHPGSLRPEAKQFDSLTAVTTDANGTASVTVAGGASGEAAGSSAVVASLTDAATGAVIYSDPVLLNWPPRDYTLLLTPVESTPTVGTTQTMTATLLLGATAGNDTAGLPPVAGQRIDFYMDAVASPNITQAHADKARAFQSAVFIGNATTDEAGAASIGFAYNASGASTYVSAFFPGDQGTAWSNQANITWLAAPSPSPSPGEPNFSEVRLQPRYTEAPEDEEVGLTATILDAVSGRPLEGIAVRFTHRLIDGRGSSEPSDGDNDNDSSRSDARPAAADGEGGEDDGGHALTTATNADGQATLLLMRREPGRVVLTASAVNSAGATVSSRPAMVNWVAHWGKHGASGGSKHHAAKQGSRRHARKHRRAGYSYEEQYTAGDDGSY